MGKALGLSLFLTGIVWLYFYFTGSFPFRTPFDSFADTAIGPFGSFGDIVIGIALILIGLYIMVKRPKYPG